MAIKRPLINPVPVELEANPPYQDLPESSEDFNGSIPSEQLKLQVANNSLRVKQRYGSLKSVMKRRLDLIEVTQFWKTPAVPFMIVSFLVNMILLFLGGLLFFGKLPPRIQLFYDPIEQAWEPEDKFVVIVIIPIIIFCLFMLQYKFISLTFKSDRRLGTALAWIMTFLNIFLLISISQIYSLNT